MNKKLLLHKLKKRELIFGFIYLPAHIFIVPALLSIVFVIYRGDIPENLVNINIAYYVVGAALILCFMFNFLKESFRKFCSNFGRSLFTLIICLLADFALSYVVAAIIAYFFEMGPNPNNESIVEGMQMSRGAMIAVVVILAPIVEEVLFRGVLFGQLARKNLIVAYVVSAVIFSAYHLWQYFIFDFSPALFLYMLQYMPVSIVLAYAYARSGNIWTPIALHMIINYLSVQVV